MLEYNNKKNKLNFKFMKKIICLFIIFLILISIFSIHSTLAATANVPLVAGQNEEVGKVNIWNSANILYVEYKIVKSNWCLVETHLHIDSNLNNFPYSGKTNNPVPGNFDYKNNHNCLKSYLYEIPLTWLPDEMVYIAAHAVVNQLSGGSETAWGKGDKFTLKGNWAMYFKYIIEKENNYINLPGLPTVITIPAIYSK